MLMIVHNVSDSECDSVVLMLVGGIVGISLSVGIGVSCSECMVWSWC